MGKELDVDQQIQVELLEQEKVRTAMVRHERDNLEEDAKHTRENRRAWGKLWRGAFATVGVLGLIAAIVVGLVFWAEMEGVPELCTESYYEEHRPSSEKRSKDIECGHPDNKVEVEEVEACGMRRVKITCTCPASLGDVAPPEPDPEVQ